MTPAPRHARHEPDGAAVRRAPTTWSPGGADAPTVAIPAVTPVERAAPAVPEVPAIGDLAAPGRPDVETVVAAEDEPGARRARPSRHMRARADEMARLLARASPASSPARRRGSSLPAAVAVMGAVAVGGVGIALGLDPQRTGVALPDAPEVPAEQTPVPETGDGTLGTDGTAAAGPTVNTGVVEALEPDVGEPRPSSVAAEARTPAGPPRAIAPTSRSGSTTSPTTTTRAEPTTRTSSPTPRSTSSPRPTTRTDGTGTSGQRSTLEGDGLDGVEAGSGFGSGDTTAN